MRICRLALRRDSEDEGNSRLDGWFAKYDEMGGLKEEENSVEGEGWSMKSPRLVQTAPLTVGLASHSYAPVANSTVVGLGRELRMVMA